MFKGAGFHCWVVVLYEYMYMHTYIWLRLATNFSLCSSQTRNYCIVHTAAGALRLTLGSTSFFSLFFLFFFFFSSCFYVCIHICNLCGDMKGLLTKPGFDAPFSCSFFLRLSRRVIIIHEPLGNFFSPSWFCLTESDLFNPQASSTSSPSLVILSASHF